MEKQTIVKCSIDNKFERDRKIVHSCNNEFILTKENIFYVETSIYEDYMVGQYYTICPNCGYMVLLDETKIPEEIKLSARGLKEEDPLLFRKNSLKSELIYLESITPKIRTRVLF